jgi:hypothetical protein
MRTTGGNGVVRCLSLLSRMTCRPSLHVLRLALEPSEPLPSCILSTTMSSQHPRRKYYAVLIGINAYPEKPLKGCVHDVQNVKKHLDAIPEAGVQTHILTASLAAENNPRHLLEEPALWPTYPNVLDVIRTITHQAEEGDFVYLHYSGHGTASRPPLSRSPTRAFSNPSTGDLALNLLQKDGRNVQYLRGYELASLIKDMTQKKLVVTLVLDCCFSGSVMRNDASVRYLEYNQQVDAAYPPNPKHCLSLEDELRQPAYRNASLRPNWMVDPAGYTVITACGPTEVDQEIKIDGQTHGALSYFLTEMFTKFGGVGGKHHYIYQFLRARFKSTRESHKHNQCLMFYGNKDLYFFGRANPRIEPTPVPVIAKQDGDVVLDVGQAHGIYEGDTFAVRTIGFKGATAFENETYESGCTARVTSVNALTSSLELSEPVVTKDVILVATQLTQLSLKRFPIRLEVDESRLEDWATTLNGQQTLNIHVGGNDNPGPDPSFNVTMVDEKTYEIRDVRNNVLVRLPGASIEPRDDIDLVLVSMEHLAKFESVKALANEAFSEPTSSGFEESFMVELSTPEGTKITPGCKRSRDHQALCAHSDCLVEVEHGSSLKLEVVNRGEPGDPALFVHAYGLYPSWQIENILKADYEVVPPRLSNKNPQFFEGASGKWAKKIGMVVPDEIQKMGGKWSDDIFKLFITCRPTSFLSLELPELGDLLNRKKGSKHRGGTFHSTSEDWVALGFRIRTCIEKA